MDRCEVLIVGAGVVGLAIGRELARRGREVIVLEQHADVGTETSARNSEVIHAGLYYPTGSLKARLCVAGRDALYAYCEAHGVPHRRCGKLLVASGDEQERKLAAVAEQAERNGVPVEALTPAQVRELEPEVVCTAALHSPLTGIIDSHVFVHSLVGELEAAEGSVATRSRFVRAFRAASELVVQVRTEHQEMSLAADWLINSAGLNAPAVASAIDGLPAASVPTTRYAKGNYFAYAGRAPFRRLVYPMPSEAGLGIHATLDMAGRVRFGPDVEWLEVPDYAVNSARSAAFSEAIREYWPALDTSRLVPDYAGIRPKIVDPGAPAADFRIDSPAVHGIDGVINLYGIESPGLTASLAIASRVASLLMR
jgi:L-2-hydroxyglutarate oxidase LhgO